MPELDETRASPSEVISREAAIPFGEPSARDPNADVRLRFFGKYRGSVFDNDDPLSQGRLLVLVPDVLGMLPSSWATPCLPFAGIDMGTFVRPSLGAGVWVEFEQGDPQSPIWTGCFWNDPPLSIPAAAAQAVPGTPVITIETPTGGLSVCDLPIGGFGAVCLRSGTAQITLTDTVIEIQAESVNITATEFSVNGTSLVVA